MVVLLLLSRVLVLLLLLLILLLMMLLVVLWVVLLLILLVLMLLLLLWVLLLILLASPTFTSFAPDASASACSYSTTVAPTTRVGNEKAVPLSVSRPLLLGHLRLAICVQHNILKNLSS